MKIETLNGQYEYEPTHLFYGKKLINKVQAKENLMLFKKVLDKSGITFGLIYGTLLGAVREKDFINHDEDVDVFILDENRENLLKLLFLFREYGFEVARYKNDLLSLIREDDYIDIYIFNKALFGRKCNGDFLPKRFFLEFDELEFFDSCFKTVHQPIKFLEFAYGKTWSVPQKNRPAEVKSTLTNIRITIIKFLPKRIFLLLKKILGKK